ncbi:Piso0_004256 [Millerozyma farinosa CBS 7064]|uniref:Mitochondrial thiamine pyrophosphate carrier 1 n=1 Tax=Pichia sorbitophila (strain ATCC MYA-4447 / BCRC 22081 / CBS 7064 / NBRC 10061 / NRRL Y-12695) TaxID=559304 RepID=G8YB07_PICSO|nr:Piso0_004256 [Millerozyma farinosa CBS 7064]CCE84702.1 Piso0_004256 [Millerozyma farinosa CBS 7064]
MSLTPLEKAASGALASVVANTLVYPLDLSKTLIQTQVKKEDKGAGAGNEKKPGPNDGHYKNTIDVLQKIYAKKGILGWYHGIFSSLFGTAAQNFSYFYWYTIVKRVHSNLYKHIPNYKPSTIVELFLGALAAAISQLFTMPIGVITTQQQTDKSARPWYRLVKEVLEQDGVSGLWRGLRVSLVLCINPSITYGSYERLRQILFGSKEHLGPLESFSIGMLAKSFATVATQPLIVSKAMMQKKSENKKPKPGVAKADGSKEDASGESAGSTEHEEITFHSFTHALHHLWKTEKHRGLYKGIAPQLVKGVFVQGLLFMFKDQIDLLFLFLLRLVKSRRNRSFK